MGTSMARKAPTGKYWRLAKTSASRFGSPKNTGQVSAAEVVARYVIAVKHNPEGIGPTPAAPIFPQIRQVAGNLGRFYQKLALYGSDQALGDLGLGELIGSPLQTTLPVLVDTLAGAGAALEEAVARSALIEVLAKEFSPTMNGFNKWEELRPGKPSARIISGRIRNFLAEAVYQKLASDLGEALEAQAKDINSGVQRQLELRKFIQGRLDPQTEGKEEFELSWSEDQVLAWIDRQLRHLLNRLEQEHGFQNLYPGSS